MTLYPVSPAGLVPLAEDADGVEVAKALVDGYRAAAGGPGGRARRRQPGADGDVGRRLRGDVAARRRAGGVRRRRRAPDGRARAGPGPGPRPDPRVRPPVRVRRVRTSWTSATSCASSTRTACRRRSRSRATPRTRRCRVSSQYQVTGRGTEQTTGLNVFFPTDPRAVRDYLTDGTTPAGWARFLSAYLSAAQSAPDGAGGLRRADPRRARGGTGRDQGPGPGRLGRGHLGGHLRADPDGRPRPRVLARPPGLPRRRGPEERAGRLGLLAGELHRRREQPCPSPRCCSRSRGA